MPKPEPPVDPSSAQKTISDIVATAPVFSEAAAAVEPAQSDGAARSKRGRGRPKSAAKVETPAPSGEASAVPSPAVDGAVWQTPFDMRDTGLWFCPKGDQPLWLSSPFEVVGMVRTADGQAWAYYVRFADPDGGEQTLIIPFSELSGDGSSVRRQFADKGLLISGRRAGREKFAEAISSIRTPRRLLLVGQTGWAADGAAFALPHKTISASDAEPIVYDGRARGAHFGEAGDLADWRGKVAALAIGQDRLLLSLALALSGPLLEPLGMDGGGFHFVGGSSIGKTSAERLAGSVWGGGGSLGFAQSWRITSNGLEGVACAHNDCFLALDEISQCDPSELGAAAYALSNGQGKGRMRSDSEMRSRLRWRIAILSSGELSLAARIGEGMKNNRVRAGQEVRIVDLQADAGTGHGIFDHPGETGNARDLADAIRDATKACYGVAGPAFVEILLNRRAEIAAAARSIIAAFVADHVPAGANGQVARVAQRFALVAAAGEIAVSVKVLPFESGAVLAAVARLFKDWIAARGGLGASESRAVIETLRQFIQAHANSRFIKIGETADGADHVNGSFRYQNVAGWRRDSDGDGKERRTNFFFNDSGWREALAGFERRAAVEALSAAGFLLKSAAGESKRAERIDGKTRRVFVILDTILEGDDSV